MMNTTCNNNNSNNEKSLKSCKDIEGMRKKDEWLLDAVEGNARVEC